MATERLLWLETAISLETVSPGIRSFMLEKRSLSWYPTTTFVVLEALPLPLTSTVSAASAVVLPMAKITIVHKPATSRLILSLFIAYNLSRCKCIGYGVTMGGRKLDYAPKSALLSAAVVGLIVPSSSGSILSIMSFFHASSAVPILAAWIASAVTLILKVLFV